MTNADWYDLNGSREYPLDDLATAVDDNDVYLPPSILVDLHLRYPRELGRYPFVGAVTVSAGLVTIVFEVADDLDAPGTASPLAVLSVRRPAAIHRQLALSPQADGVGGWAVLGSGANSTTHYAGRFSTPRQGVLLARAARGYRARPIDGVKVLHADRLLRGIVKFTADPPLELVADTRTIQGVERDVIIVRLVQPDQTGGFAARNPPNSVFAQFAGPCGARPESQNCQGPQPIEFIDGVGPDCSGQITLDFRGCSVMAPIEGDACGIVISCPLSLSQACRSVLLPDDAGDLPSEVPPADIPVPTPGTTTTTTPAPESIVILGELPYTECFDDLTADDFEVRQGAYVFIVDESPIEICPLQDMSISDSLSVADASYAAWSLAERNISIWNGFDESTLQRRVITDIKMLTGPSGAKHNAGVIINYRPHISIPGRYVYYLGEVDYDAQVLRLSYFNGVALQTLSETFIPALALDRWYRLQALTFQTGSQVSLRVDLSGIDQVLEVILGPIDVNDYYPSSGVFGLSSNRARSLFSFFRIEMTVF